MQVPPEEAEPARQGHSFSTSAYYFNLVVTFAWLFLILWTFYEMSQDDDLKLHALHWLMRSAQKIAAHFGTIALLAEQAYNNAVDTIH